MLPYHISSSHSADSLYKLKDGRYQLTTGGQTAPLMTGPDYILIDETFLNCLRDLGAGGFSSEPATVFRRSENISFTNYSRIHVENGFTIREFNGEDFDLSGDRLIHSCHQHLFCTPTLAAKMIKLEIPFIAIDYGFGGFA